MGRVGDVRVVDGEESDLSLGRCCDTNCMSETETYPLSENDLHNTDHLDRICYGLGCLWVIRSQENITETRNTPSPK